MKLDMLKGHAIKEINGEWFYYDNNEKVSETWKTRVCGKCDKANTPEGHDACLGELIGVMNACCGHGNDSEAYAQYENCEIVQGKLAIAVFNELKEKA